MNIKLGHIKLFVQNSLKSIHFYCNALGFQLVDNQNNQFIWVKGGEMEILLRPGNHPITNKTMGAHQWK